MTEDRIDLVIEFLEQELKYAKNKLEEGMNPRKPNDRKMNFHLIGRVSWHRTIIGLLKDSKTEEGLRQLKAAIETNKKKGL